MFDDELAAIPEHPPRAGRLPGMRLGAAIPKSALVLLMVFVAFFTVFPLSIMMSDPKVQLAVGPSRAVEGRVLSVTQVPGCRDSAAHRIVYAFAPEPGNELRGGGLVCQQSPDYSTQAGDTIEIRYLARDPAVNGIAWTDPGNAPPIFFFAIFPLFVLLVLSPLYLPHLREVMRARRLYRRGTLVQGKVVFVKKRGFATWPGWPGGSAADVYVAHPLPGGGQAEAVVWCTNEWLVNHLSPGTTVHILLPSDRSARGSLLEAFIR